VLQRLAPTGFFPASPILGLIGALAALALLCAGEAQAQNAPAPKRGGVLEFAVDAEPGDYDCHSNVSFAFLHPVAPSNLSSVE
jgi:peptide/nickel transport system substrate-binding protein